MNNKPGFDENRATENYIATFIKLYEERDFIKALYALEKFNCVPEELHKLATNVLIQTAGKSSLYYRIGLNYLTWRRERLPLGSSDRERLLSVILDIAANSEGQDQNGGYLWDLSYIDDPKVFRTLVKIYKNDAFPERKKAAIYQLGRGGKEEALPILFDHFYQHQTDLTDEEIDLLNKYPVSERMDSIQTVTADDRDKVVARFIKYLQDNKDYADECKTTIAHSLAILYTSRMTSSGSKEIIKASANVPICYGYDEFHDEPSGYVYLKEFVDLS